MNITTTVALRVVVALHRKPRQDGEQARTTRGQRRPGAVCGDPELCGICSESRHLFPFPCGAHGVPAGEPCGDCLDALDWAYLLAPVDAAGRRAVAA